MKAVTLKKVRELQNFSFFIPFYQRGYRWNKQQITELLHDIDQPSDGNFYFLQALVVVRTEDGSWRVVDGQQRLTTLQLILNYLETSLFTIAYERGEATEQGLDSSFKKKALECIKEFFENKKAEAEDKKAFLDKVQNQCRFLFYEIPAEDEQRTFRELNSGKISATDSDLVKYLLLKPGSEEDSSVTQARAEEWDEIERKMNDDAFFAFMTPRNTWREEDRMTILFRYAGFTVSPGMEVFPFLMKIEEELKTSSRAEVWKKISAAFHQLEEWFRDPLFYYAFGWYVHRRGGSAPGKLEEVRWREELEKAARYPIPAPDETRDDYQQGQNDPLHRYLLLHNVACCWSRQTRYDFVRHRRVGVWSLEHIFARNQRDLEREELEQWLPECTQQLWEKYQQECRNNQGNKWLADKLGEKYPEEEVDNSIRNLALLPQDANASFNNKLFEEKQKLAAQWSENGWTPYWIPPATEAVFQKSLPGVTSDPYWSNEDKEAYLKYLKSSVNSFVEAVTRRFPEEKTDRFFELLTRYRVEIPCIQRHYVQGADTPRARDVRTNFIQTLYSACTKGTPVLLHFIYGPARDGVFTPVDGQQRLTTLWLFARYAAERSSAEKRSAVLPQLSRFSYMERPCANQFCRALTTQAMGWQPDVDPAESIPAQPWFQQEWQLDTTVASMLRMLSTIHEKFKSDVPEKIEKIWDCLQNQITFQLLTDNFPDDIYLKLNARGLQLTQWENFKGEFAGLLGKSRCIWNKKIEELSDAFFTRAEEALPDDAFFALAARLAVAQANMKSRKCGAQIEKLANQTEWKEELPFVPFHEFTESLPESVADRDKFAIHYLRLVDRILQKIKEAAELPSPYWQKERKLLQSVFYPQDRKDQELSTLLFFYFAKNWRPDPEDFQKALRCMWNILENTEVTKESFPKLYRWVTKLSKRKDNILDFLSKVKILKKCGKEIAQQNKDDRLFDQLREESIKAKIYQNAEQNKEKIELLQKAENNLHGRVRLGILNLKEERPDFSEDRLKKLNELFEAWNIAKEDSESRKTIVLNIVAAEPFELQDEIYLSTEDDNLRALLITRDDKSIQEHLCDMKTDSIPTQPFSDWKADESPKWKRDWRQSLLNIANGVNGYNVYTKYLWEKGRHIHYHEDSGIYALYSNSKISGALPIGDWRIELGVEGSPFRKWYEEATKETELNITINKEDMCWKEITWNEEKANLYLGIDQISFKAGSGKICLKFSDVLSKKEKELESTLKTELNNLLPSQTSTSESEQSPATEK